jgi:hypothetical protein
MKDSSQVDVRHKDKEEDAEYRDDGDDDDDDDDDDEEDSLISLLNLDDDTSVELNSDEEVHSLPRYFIELRLWASHAVLVLHCKPLNLLLLCCSDSRQYTSKFRQI